MKILLIILSLSFCNICFANDIDKLQTNLDVNLFLIKKVDKELRYYYSKPLNSSKKNVEPSFGDNTFFKLDIDGNGLTDLIVSGRKLIVILDKGENVYQANYLDRADYKVKLIFIDSSTDIRKIVIQQSKFREGKRDTLIYKFNKFIEYHPEGNNDFKFEGIIFRTGGCYGTCPIFEMSVLPNKMAFYKAIEYNDEKGNFSGTIPEKEFDELIEILKYIEPDKLDTNYFVNWTDDQTATIEIKYNGKKKTIVDYGEIGTFGLGVLYSKFFVWRRQIGWNIKKIDDK